MIRHCVAAVVGALVLAGACGGSGSDVAPTTTEAPQTTRILFVGNSLTFWHDGLDTYVPALATSGGPARQVEAESFTAAGLPLSALWTRGAADVIADGEFDVVITQETLQFTDVESFHQHARLFDAEIRASGARHVLLMAWPDRAQEEVTLDEVAGAHDAIAEELGAEIAPVGHAWQRVREERPDLELYDFRGLDEVHPSIHGSYLTASVIDAVVFGDDPATRTYVLDGITDDDATYLRQAAWDTVADIR